MIPGKFARTFLVAALLSGCSLGPKYERPAVELPAAWQDSPAQGLKADGERWWKLYSDPALDRLIEEALTHNQDLALATARVDEARALARVADAQLYPGILASA